MNVSLSLEEVLHLIPGAVVEERNGKVRHADGERVELRTLAARCRTHVGSPASRNVVVVGGSRAGHLRKFLEARALIFRPALSEVNFAELLLKRTGSRP